MRNTENTTLGEMARNRDWSKRGTLHDLRDELHRQLETKVDFVADSRSLMASCGHGDGEIYVESMGPEAGKWLPDPLPLTDDALAQIGARQPVPVPVKFIRRLAAEQPVIACQLITDLLHCTGKQHFIRTLDGSIRALLSNRYRVMDHLDAATAVLDTAREYDAEILEATLTPRHMRIKLVRRDLWDRIDETRSEGKGWYPKGLGSQTYLSRVAARSVGDLPGGPESIHPCFTVENSETGHGGLSVRIGLLRAACFNLATVEDVARHVHLGATMDTGIYAGDTAEADGRAILLKVRDMIRAAFTEDVFRELIEKANLAAGVKIVHAKPAIEQIVQGTGITEDVRDEVFGHFLRDYSSAEGGNAWGLAQAIGRAAQDANADTANELETIAGRVIAQPKLAGKLAASPAS